MTVRHRGLEEEEEYGIEEDDPNNREKQMDFGNRRWNLKN